MIKLGIGMALPLGVVGGGCGGHYLWPCDTFPPLPLPLFLLQWNLRCTYSLLVMDDGMGWGWDQPRCKQCRSSKHTPYLRKPFFFSSFSRETSVFCLPTATKRNSHGVG